MFRSRRKGSVWKWKVGECLEVEGRGVMGLSEEELCLREDAWEGDRCTCIIMNTCRCIIICMCITVPCNMYMHHVTYMHNMCTCTHAQAGNCHLCSCPAHLCLDAARWQHSRCRSHQRSVHTHARTHTHVRTHTHMHTHTHMYRNMHYEFVVI